jgi:hypothetical protein
MTRYRSVAPTVHHMVHSLRDEADACAEQLLDVSSWWSQVGAADVAFGCYLHSLPPDSALPGEPAYQPQWTSSATHDGWKAACAKVIDEMDRQSARADCLNAEHAAEAGRLRAQADAAGRQCRQGDQSAADAAAAQAARLRAAAAVQARSATLASQWHEAAAVAAAAGRLMVQLYDQRWAELNAAVARAGGDAAAVKTYHDAGAPR